MNPSTNALVGFNGQEVNAQGQVYLLVSVGLWKGEASIIWLSFELKNAGAIYQGVVTKCLTSYCNKQWKHISTIC